MLSVTAATNCFGGELLVSCRPMGTTTHMTVMATPLLRPCLSSGWSKKFTAAVL